MNFERVRQFMDHLTRTKVPGNAICIYLGGQKVFEYASGYADLETQTPMTGRELMNIYSCSKVTTVTAAAQLQTDFTHGWRLYRLPVRRSPTASASASRWHRNKIQF